jgi:hypothetical protein
MAHDKIPLRWSVDLVDQSAKLGDGSVCFSDGAAGSFSAVLDGMGEVDLCRKLSLLREAIEEFESALARATHVR